MLRSTLFDGVAVCVITQVSGCIVNYFVCGAHIVRTLCAYYAHRMRTECARSCDLGMMYSLNVYLLRFSTILNRKPC